MIKPITTKKHLYLIKIGDGWLDVRGEVIANGTMLLWWDSRDNTAGVAREFIDYYPRPLSQAERCKKVSA